MSNYVIFADSACDISAEKMAEWGVKFCDLSFMFNDSVKTYSNFDLPIKEFYQKMRDGGIAKTAAVNVETFKSVFEEELKQGNDVLYLAFSSGLSTTYNSGRMAAEELSEQYPDRKVIAVDTLAASAGYGLLLYLAVQEKNTGATMDEVAKYVEDIRLKICHWFTVEDLVYLKRGGRVSPTVAFVGGVLGIKPVLHVDNEGHLINMFKERGRKKSLEALAKKYGELALDAKDGTVFISHGDCEDDAKSLADLLKERYGVNVALITPIGPVIGAHSGPGTMALFFLGKER